MPCMKGRSSHPMRLCSLSHPPRSSFSTMVTKHSWEMPAAWYLLDSGAIVKPADAICTQQSESMGSHFVSHSTGTTNWFEA